MIQINLLPVREERRKAGVRQLGLLLGTALVGSVLVVGLFHWKLRSDISGARDHLAKTQAEVEGYKEQLEQVETFRKTKEQIEQKLGVIERLDRSRSGPVRVMDELATHAPERLWLTRLSSAGGQIGIEGISLDNEIVAAFASALDESPFFVNVELQGTEATQIEGFKLNKFKISAAMSTPGAGVQQTAAAGAAAPAGAGR